jgi:hypothetical protein
MNQAHALNGWLLSGAPELCPGAPCHARTSGGRRGGTPLLSVVVTEEHLWPEDAFEGDPHVDQSGRQRERCDDRGTSPIPERLFRPIRHARDLPVPASVREQVRVIKVGCGGLPTGAPHPSIATMGSPAWFSHLRVEEVAGPNRLRG